jgi:hypothetical protein
MQQMGIRLVDCVWARARVSSRQSPLRSGQSSRGYVSRTLLRELVPRCILQDHFALFHSSKASTERALVSSSFAVDSTTELMHFRVCKAGIDFALFMFEAATTVTMVVSIIFQYQNKREKRAPRELSSWDFHSDRRFVSAEKFSPFAGCACHAW